MNQDFKLFINIFDKIGFNGPLIILIITIYSLWKQERILIFYLFFALINIYFNRGLKLLIKQPRPIGFDKETNVTNHMEMYENGDQYGMPSGHSNLSFYSIFYNYLANPKITNNLWLMIFVALITVSQRFKYKKHTLEQLFVGGIVGMIYAYTVFNISKISMQNY